jgi:hypothetical protein
MEIAFSYTHVYGEIHAGSLQGDANTFVEYHNSNTFLLVVYVVSVFYFPRNRLHKMSLQYVADTHYCGRIIELAQRTSKEEFEVGSSGHVICGMNNA